MPSVDRGQINSCSRKKIRNLPKLMKTIQLLQIHTSTHEKYVICFPHADSLMLLF